MQEKEYAELLGSYTENRVSALKEEIAAERSRVVKLVEQQHQREAAALASAQRQEQVTTWLQRMRVGRSVFGGKGTCTRGQSINLKEFEGVVSHLQDPEMTPFLKERDLSEVALAAKELDECCTLSQWAVQEAHDIESLCQSKNAGDIDKAAAQAQNLKKVLFEDSALGKALLDVGEECVVRAWQIVEATEKAAQDKAQKKDKAAVATAPVQSSSLGGAGDSLPEHVREAQEQVAWLQTAVELRDKNRDEGVADGIKDSLQMCVERIQEMGGFTEDKRNTSSLLQIISVIEEAVSASVASATFESAKQFILIDLFCAILQQTIAADSEEMVMMLSHVCGALCRMTGKTGGRLLRAMLYSSCSLAVPHVAAIQRVQCIPGAQGEEQQRRIVMLMAGQMVSFQAPVVVDLAAGWTWVRRMGVLLYQNGTVSSTLTHLSRVCRSFLRIAGNSLREAYGKEFVSLLTHILGTLPTGDASGPGVKDLRELLSSVLESGRVPTVLFRNQDAYGIYAGTVVK